MTPRSDRCRDPVFDDKALQDSREHGLYRDLCERFEVVLGRLCNSLVYSDVKLSVEQKMALLDALAVLK